MGLESLFHSESFSVCFEDIYSLLILTFIWLLLLFFLTRTPNAIILELFCLLFHRCYLSRTPEECFCFRLNRNQLTVNSSLFETILFSLKMYVPYFVNLLQYYIKTNSYNFSCAYILTDWYWISLASKSVFFAINFTKKMRFLCWEILICIKLFIIVNTYFNK